jgi:hypothetical protein
MTRRFTLRRDWLPETRFDETEAWEVAVARERELRRRSYDELRRELNTDEGKEIFWEEIIGRSGTTYFLAIYACWDAGKRDDGNLRVWIDIDDGTKRSFRQPLTTSFIIGPDGSFVGEY